MKRLILFFATAIVFAQTNAQQINGVFTDFAVNNQWGSTAINSAVQETSGYITLGGYYEGRSQEKKMPMMLQINSDGVIRSDFGGGGVALLSFISSTYGNTELDKTHLANTSSVANSQQFILAGHREFGDGFMFKMFGNGTRPTAFNNANITTYSGGAGSAVGYIQDWVTGPFIYNVRINGATFTQCKVVLSSFNRNTGAPATNFADGGTLRIDPPEGYVVDQARPTRIVQPSTGTHTNKFYVAFSVVPVMGTNVGIAVCRINVNGGTIDSSYGTNGYKTFSTSSRYYITSLLANNNESITVSGYGGDGMQSPPSFFTFNADESMAITAYNYLLGESHPGYGSKNMAAKKATINGQERIVFAYAHPINEDEQYRIAIASLTPNGGAAGDPLAHTPWLGEGFVSAEPTAIVALSGNGGFIVAGKATRNNGTLAGVVLKYTNNGTLDASFGTQGVLIINGHAGGRQWTHAAQLSTNKYMAVGRAEFVPANFSKKAILLNRFHSDGSIDSSFGTNGSLFALQSDNDRYGGQVVPLPNGEFFVLGTYFSTVNEPGTAGGAADNEGILCKFNADGTPQFSFGPYNNGRYHYAGGSFNNVLLTADNIYMTANSGVLKLSSGGNYVSSYGTGLSLIQEYALNEATGNIYAGGVRTGVTAKQVVKVLPSGNVDQSFGNSGYVSIPIPVTGDNVNLRELKRRSNGSLFTVLHWNNSAATSYGVFFSSISEAGVLDVNFGTNGAKFLELPGASNILVSRNKWSGQNNDKLLIFGQATVNGAPQGFVCQVDLNGELDPEFGNGGVIWTTENFVGTVGFDNKGNALAIKDYGFYKGVALAKVNIPADVYNHISQGSWTGAIDNDWFKPGNWSTGLVPDAFTAVTITNANVLIGAGMHAFAWSVSVGTGATVTMGANSTLEVTEENP